MLSMSCICCCHKPHTIALRVANLRCRVHGAHRVAVWLPRYSVRFNTILGHVMRYYAAPPLRLLAVFSDLAPGYAALWLAKQSVHTGTL